MRREAEHPVPLHELKLKEAVPQTCSGGDWIGPLSRAMTPQGIGLRLLSSFRQRGFRFSDSAPAGCRVQNTTSIARFLKFIDPYQRLAGNQRSGTAVAVDMAASDGRVHADARTPYP
jgi:hypothetical protein